MFHLVCEIIVKHVDGTYLIIQRDYDKHLGGTWEASAGGSAFKGETPFECAKRELFEETGIKADTLLEIGRVVNHKHQSIYFEYLCETNIDKNNIVLEEGETIFYKWVPLREPKEMPNDEFAIQRFFSFVEELSHRKSLLN